MKDIFIKYASAFGIPRLAFEWMISVNENSGVYAITSTINRFSLENGMVYGIGVIVFIAIFSYKVASFLILKYYQRKIERDRIELMLENTEAVLNQVDTYSVSKSLQRIIKAKYLLHNY